MGGRDWGERGAKVRIQNSGSMIDIGVRSSSTVVLMAGSSNQPDSIHLVFVPRLTSSLRVES